MIRKRKKDAAPHDDKFADIFSSARFDDPMNWTSFGDITKPAALRAMMTTGYVGGRDGQNKSSTSERVSSKEPLLETSL